MTSTSTESLILGLAKQAREANSESVLRFLVLNQSHQLAPYSLALLWLSEQGIVGASHVSDLDRQAPFVLFANRLAQQLQVQSQACVILPEMITSHDIQEWPDYFPAHALWLPFHTELNKGGLIFFRDQTWSSEEAMALKDWVAIWAYSYQTYHQIRLQQYLISKGGDLLGRLPTFNAWRQAWIDIRCGAVYVWQTHCSNFERIRQSIAILWGKCRESLLTRRPSQGSWIKDIATEFKALWQDRSRRYFWLLMIVIFYPVRLTVSLPSEIVAANPAIIRMPIEGVVEQFFITPNQKVAQGQLLLKLDTTTLSSKLQVAQQETQVASAEYRQGALQSLLDAKSRLQLAGQQGKTLEKQIEMEYVKDLLEKSQIKAPASGVAIFDDPSMWIGKPVAAGEKVLMIAKDDAVEVEAWLSLADALDFPERARLVFYLHASPLNPVASRLKYISHEPVARPDGSYAYRVRALIESTGKQPRIGLKGTSKLYGQLVPLSYWLLRKPLASLRSMLGW